MIEFWTLGANRRGDSFTITSSSHGELLGPSLGKLSGLVYKRYEEQLSPFLLKLAHSFELGKLVPVKYRDDDATV